MHYFYTERRNLSEVEEEVGKESDEDFEILL